MPKRPTVFISYADADKPHVDRIKQLLDGMKVHYVSDEPFSPGAKWNQRHRRALEKSDYFIACISPNYLTSEWLNFELGMALGKAVPAASKIVPLLLRPTTMPTVLKNFKFIDAGKGSGHAVEEQLKEALELA